MSCLRGTSTSPWTSRPSRRSKSQSNKTKAKNTVVKEGPGGFYSYIEVKRALVLWLVLFYFLDFCSIHVCVRARAALPAGNGVQNWRLGVPRSSGDRHGVQGPVEPRFLVRLVPPDDLPSLPPSSSSGGGGGLAAARRGIPTRASEVVRPPEARAARIAQLGLLRRPPSPLGGLAHPAVITGASRLVLGRGPPPRGGYRGSPPRRPRSRSPRRSPRRSSPGALSGRARERKPVSQLECLLFALRIKWI